MHFEPIRGMEVGEFSPDPFYTNLNKYYTESSIIFQIFFNKIMKMHEKKYVINSLE